MLTRNKGKSLVEFPTSFTVIDIETTGLDTTMDSIVELSAARIRDDEIADVFSALVNPQQPIGWWITELTGITDDMTKDAPLIDAVLGDFIDFLGDDVIVGHNVNFDINFIYDNLQRVTGKDFSNDYIDTLRLARFLLRDLDNHRLESVAGYFGLNSEIKHRGLDDAKITLEVMFALKDKAIETYGNIGKFEDQFANSLKGLNAKDVTSKKVDFDITHPLYGMSCVFTGTLAKMPRKQAFQMVVDFGGQVENSITKKTNYLIVGSLEYAENIQGGKSNKLKKAEQMMVDGRDIQILSENAFYDIIDA